MAISVPVPEVVVGLVVGVATVIDLRTLKVHNLLTLPLLATGLLYGWMSGGGAGLAGAFAGAALGFFVLFPPYLLGGMGAGDLKLTAAAGAWLGPSRLLLVVSISLFLCAAWSLAVLAWRRRLSDAWLYLKTGMLQSMALVRLAPSPGNAESVHEMAKTAAGRRRLVPFSGMIGIGVLAILVWQHVAQG
jgi:prepilin peptidase CpaA